jgi:hypothetical protein
MRRVPVLYAAESRRGAFMETLDQYRFDVATMVEIQSQTGVLDEAQHRSFGRIPPSYFQRLIAAFRVAPGQRWLDARSPATHVEVLKAMAAVFRDLDVGPRITLGHLLSGDYRIPRTFTQWAIENGYNGIAYASCHDLESTCWALFEGAFMESIEQPDPIDPQDPDLLEVARLWELALPELP